MEPAAPGAPANEPSSRPPAFWGSSVAVRGFLWLAILLLLLGTGTLGSIRDRSHDPAGFIEQTTGGWCETYGAREDLQALIMDVHFRAAPPDFASGEGVVVAPVGLELPGAQRLLAMASHPPLVRELTAGGVTAAAWEYAGRVHRDLRFTAVALVERPPHTPVTPGEDWTFDGLPEDLRAEALARASDLRTHGLERCKAFPEWARETAGPLPHTEQLLRLVRAVTPIGDDEDDSIEDICAAIREGEFTGHRAQVAAVMGAREVGIPAFGFTAASRQVYLVGTYTDQAGWVLVDLEDPEAGWFTGGTPLVTMAPLLGGFPASFHDLWYPGGAAYTRAPWGGGVTQFSGTAWKGRLVGDRPTDTTEARVTTLAEACS